MCDYNFFPKDLGWWDKNYQSLLGCHNICPLLEQFHVTQMTQLELSSLTGSGAWGNTKKFHSDLPYLFVSPKKATEEEMVFGWFAMVWVHPYQACIPTLDEAVRKLTLLTASHKNWAYTFYEVQWGQPTNPPALREVNLVLWLSGCPVEMHAMTSAN